MTAALPNKPLPVVTDLTRPFWTAAKERRFVMQKCGRCSTCNFPPKPWCVECGARALEWVDAQPGGTVYSFTVSRSVAMNYPGWQADLPIVLALVDVDDGARMYAQVTDCAPEDVRIGMRVEVHFKDISEEFGVPKFRPARDG